ncbi:hypothetical protein IE81DRAFT_62735 [Ceraceosorus guamensis]|uniref:Uncharacterized protein n=1 Tax=Ceraceosorus guamensis TaxID=1522189 RepID=A0A316VTX8_9BASI|nr:hypothetical protein IE81DRAFT_62735 [Ceraceosorus guamensis]PWN38955.1 hypothetical protein IE81DRAFT_62735 [Ceraceosorus guamensis]
MIIQLLSTARRRKSSTVVQDWAIFLLYEIKASLHTAQIVTPTLVAARARLSNTKGTACSGLRSRLLILGVSSLPLLAELCPARSRLANERSAAYTSLRRPTWTQVHCTSMSELKKRCDLAPRWRSVDNVKRTRSDTTEQECRVERNRYAAAYHMPYCRAAPAQMAIARCFRGDAKPMPALRLMNGMPSLCPYVAHPTRRNE